MKQTRTGVSVPDRLYYFLLDFNDSTDKKYIAENFGKAALNELTKDEIISLTNHAMLSDLELIDNYSAHPDQLGLKYKRKWK